MAKLGNTVREGRPMCLRYSHLNNQPAIVFKTSERCERCPLLLEPGMPHDYMED
jgi:hypothetical protein